MMLAGSPQEATGAQLRTQWTSGLTVSMQTSRFLAGKTGPARARSGSPANPTFTAAATSDSASSLAAGTYAYYVTAVSIRGESVPSPTVSQVVAAGERATLTISAVSGALWFNVYRSAAGGSAATAKFIGKVKAALSGTTAFRDLGNKIPGFVTGYLLQTSTGQYFQLAPFSRLKLAVTELSLPEASFAFKTLALKQPRKNVLFDNVNGQTA
jgi:hypothetical protein